MGVDLDEKRDEEQLGGVERSETVIRIYYKRKKSIFNKMKKSLFSKFFTIS